MAKINFTNVVVGVGAGAVDEVLEWQDEKNARTEMAKQWQTWGRIGMALAGYAGLMMNFQPKYADPLAQSSITLVTKTVGKAIRNRSTIPAQAPPTVARRSVGWKAPGSHFERTYQPEFEESGAY